MKPQELAQGKLISIDWSHDSESLLIRREADLLRAEVNKSSALVSVDTVSLNYRMSSWSPNSKMIGMIQPGLGGDVLTVSSATGYLNRQIGDVSGNVAFMWSPNGNRIALGESLDNEDYLLKRLKLVDVESGKSSILKETSIIAFFWAPDGRKIAYVAVGDSGENLQWRILDLDSGVDTQIARFDPSHDQLVWYAFFDQFGESHQVWSPDSTRITFAGSLDQEGIEEGSRIYIADLNDVGNIRVLGRGYLATWSNH
jgi:TolB protein